jgi:selenocysteine lyase/cysteine desulfurase
MREIGIEETERHVRGLTELLLDGVDELGGVVVTPRPWDRRGALTCVASTDAEQLVAVLSDQGIVTSSRDGNLRISPHCYNSAQDIETVLEALRRHRTLLRRAA